MNEELSLSRVVKALEKKIVENPTAELLAGYAALLDRMNTPTLEEMARVHARLEAFEKRIQFVESGARNVRSNIGKFGEVIS